MIKSTVVLLGIILLTSSISYSYAEHSVVPSPRQQLDDGVTSKNIQCNVGLQLMIKYNGNPACVKPSSASKLSSANWGIIQGDVVTVLPSHSNEMKLEEDVDLDDNDSQESENHKISLKESMDMAGG